MTALAAPAATRISNHSPKSRSPAHPSDSQPPLLDLTNVDPYQLRLPRGIRSAAGLAGRACYVNKALVWSVSIVSIGWPRTPHAKPQPNDFVPFAAPPR